MGDSGAANRTSAEGCGQAAEAVRFDGLVMANVSTFTMTPDRRIVSVIFDDLDLAWVPSQRGADTEDLSQVRELAIAVPPSARGKPVRCEVSGYWSAIGDGAAPTVVLTIGAAKHSAELPPQEGDIHLAVETQAGEEILAIVIEARIPAPADPATEVRLTIDSIDVALTD
jgi:hypothetical protein